MVPVDFFLHPQESLCWIHWIAGREHQIPWLMSMFPYENYHLEVINDQMFREKNMYTSYCLLEIPLSQVYPIKSPHHIP